MTDEENPKLEGKTSFKTYEYRDMLVATRFSVGGRRRMRRRQIIRGRRFYEMRD